MLFCSTTEFIATKSYGSITQPTTFDGHKILSTHARTATSWSYLMRMIRKMDILTGMPVLSVFSILLSSTKGQNQVLKSRKGWISFSFGGLGLMLAQRLGEGGKPRNCTKLGLLRATQPLDLLILQMSFVRSTLFLDFQTAAQRICWVAHSVGQLLKKMKIGFAIMLICMFTPGLSFILLANFLNSGLSIVI